MEAYDPYLYCMLKFFFAAVYLILLIATDDTIASVWEDMRSSPFLALAHADALCPPPLAWRGSQHVAFTDHYVWTGLRPPDGPGFAGIVHERGQHRSSGRKQL